MPSERDLDDELRKLGRDPSVDDGMEERVLAAVFSSASGGDVPLPRIARFEVVRRIGLGGMGSVFEAHDPTLDRRVAIKLLHRAMRPRDWSAEARALARLAHQNVVRVFEVGAEGDRLFVVMELIVGTDLLAWQRQPRAVAEIVDKFVQAGRGLAAAHRVGLVHRDFKPANVLVGDDGVVRVADFGLAVTFDAPTEPTTPAASPSTGPPTSSPFAGTLAYMAPEQLAYEQVDTRSDQYAFCTSLYEALTGVLPFRSEQRVAMVSAGAPQVPAAGWSRMPRWLARVLRRGLSPRPEDRWRSMDALVDALELAPRRRRRAAIVGGIILAVATGWAVFERANRPSCDPTDALAPVWSERAAAELVATAPAEPRFAASALAVAAAQLDRHAATWRESYRAACEATWIAGTRTPESFDETVACLEVARRDLALAVDLLSAHRSTTLARADDVVDRLRDPHACTEEVVARRGLTARDRELESAAGRARLLVAAGESRSALDVLDTLELDDADFGASAAQAWLARGEVLRELARFADAEAALTNAVRLAVAAENDHVRLMVLETLASYYGHAMPDRGRAELIVALLEGVGRRVELQVRDRAALAAAKGLVAGLRGDDESAIANHREAVTVLATAGDDEPQSMARYRRDLGAALQQAGRRAEARAIYDEVADDLVRVLGDAHPSVAEIERARGSVALEEGDIAEARRSFLHALEIDEAAFGADWVGLGVPLAVLAHAALLEHDYAGAERLAARGWALEQSLPVGHPDRGSSLAVLATAHAQLGAYSESLDEHDRLFAEMGNRMTEAFRAGLDLNIGWLLCRLGRCKEARPRLEQAMMMTAENDTVHLHASACLAEVELAEGYVFAAIERAERLLGRDEVLRADDPGLLAELRATRVLARVQAGNDATELSAAAGEAADALAVIRGDDDRIPALRRIAGSNGRASELVSKRHEAN